MMTAQIIQQIKYRIYLIVLGCALFACTPQAPLNTSGLQAVTPVPTLDRQQSVNTTLTENPTPEQAVTQSPTPAEVCDVAETDSTEAAAPAYVPSNGAFVYAQNNRFWLNGRTFPIYGIDYYPRDTPWRRFLTETNADNLPQEIDLLQQVGINTLRITLRHDLLFQCGGKSLIPISDNIVRLDSIIQTAAQYHFHLIVVLNDVIDSDKALLYTQTDINKGQVSYLAERYRDEPAIIGWDLRDSGDLDYRNGSFERQRVLKWLADTAILLRGIDPNHLITASWKQDITAPIGVVDFVSLRASSDLDTVRQQIAVLNEATDTPILLTSIGYSTYGSSEEGQRDSLQAALDAARNNHLAGWLVWTAFDFPLTVTCYTPGCTNQDSADHHYGLWTTEYAPKLTVDVLRFATDAE